KPRATISRTGSGPSTANNSLPTLMAQARGSNCWTSASAADVLSKSSATIIRGSLPTAATIPPSNGAGPDRSCIAVRRLGPARRVGLPFQATGTAPIVLLRPKPALLATIQTKPFDMLTDQALHKLE